MNGDSLNLKSDPNGFAWYSYKHNCDFCRYAEMLVAILYFKFKSPFGITIHMNALTYDGDENLENNMDLAHVRQIENELTEKVKTAKAETARGKIFEKDLLQVNKKLFLKKSGSKLDVGCGSNKQPGWIGMDKRQVKGVDIVHDVQNFPWPVPDNSCFQVLLSHLWEHIEPKYRMELMEELYRITMKNGQLLISVPYCMSMGAFQDPTHYPCPTEATFTYFDPDHPLYNVYKPSPWKLVRNAWQANGNMEVILEPRKN